MPTETLSERLLEHARVHQTGWSKQWGDDLHDAARWLQPFEQPEVADLLAEAARCDTYGTKFRADRLRAHARALVELAEAREENGRLREENQRVQSEAARMIREAEEREAEAPREAALEAAGGVGSAEAGKGA